jgi:uncharacterized protein
MDNPNSKREQALDEAIDESFPASDPPANTVETGVAGSPQDVVVNDNRAASCFEFKKNGQVAFLNYQRGPGSVVLVHTEVPPSLRGHHVGEALAAAAIASVRAEGLTVVAQCSFVRSYLSKHPELAQ